MGDGFRLVREVDDVAADDACGDAGAPEGGEVAGQANRLPVSVVHAAPDMKSNRLTCGCHPTWGG